MTDFQWIRRATPDDRNGWKHMTTLEQHLGMYGSSSGYTEL